MKNEPAFPSDIYFDEQRIDQTSGLTKREYFAAMAMQGLLASWPQDADSPRYCAVNVAHSAQTLADALIEALKDNP